MSAALVGAVGRILNIVLPLWARGPDEGKRDAQEPHLPRAGMVYSFRTAPYSDLSPTKTGRYAAFKILAADARVVAYAVLDGVWDAPPTARLVGRAAILKEWRFALSGRPAVFGVPAKRWQPADLFELAEVTLLRLSRSEKAIALKIASFSAGFRYTRLATASYAAEGEWRWKHDRKALEFEGASSELMAKADRARAEQLRQKKLKELTWDTLLSQAPFSSWDADPSTPRRAFAAAARERVFTACRELRDLGSRPPRAKVRAILRSCVIWFNEADELAGHPIETTEREDICEVLEEMAHVALQPRLADEIDAWREW